jgi:hypothetical protein
MSSGLSGPPNKRLRQKLLSFAKAHEIDIVKFCSARYGCLIINFNHSDITIFLTGCMFQPSADEPWLYTKPHCLNFHSSVSIFLYMLLNSLNCYVHVNLCDSWLWFNNQYYCLVFLLSNFMNIRSNMMKQLQVESWSFIRKMR